MRKRKRNVVAEAKRYNSQSLYTRSWQVSPLGGPHQLRMRGPAKAFMWWGVGMIAAVVIGAVILSIVSS